MTIAFGLKSFILKSYSAIDLNLVGQVIDNISFEVRQQYFHFFFIPFFSTKKYYVEIRNGEPFPMDPKYITLINTKDKFKAPWYSFAGLLLIPVGISVLFGLNLYTSYLKVKRSERFIQKKIDKIDHPTKMDFYDIDPIKYSGTYIAKVEDFTADSILLKIPKNRKHGYTQTSYLKHGYLDELESSHKLVWISKDVLKTAIEDDPKDLNGFKGVAIQKILGNLKFDIDAIRRIK